MVKRALQGVLLAALVLLVPAASWNDDKAQASGPYCAPELSGVFFSPDTSTPNYVYFEYHYVCAGVIVDAAFNDPATYGCPNAIYSELQGYLPADDCWTVQVNVDRGTGGATDIFLSRTCKDNLLSHKQHIGAGEVLWNEHEISSNSWVGTYAYWFPLNGYTFNGPYYNRRCWL